MLCVNYKKVLTNNSRGISVKKLTKLIHMWLLLDYLQMFCNTVICSLKT